MGTALLPFNRFPSPLLFWVEETGVHRGEYVIFTELHG